MEKKKKEGWEEDQKKTQSEQLQIMFSNKYLCMRGLF